MALERKVTVRVDVLAGGDFDRKMQQNARTAEKMRATLASQPAGGGIKAPAGPPGIMGLPKPPAQGVPTSGPALAAAVAGPPRPTLPTIAQQQRSTATMPGQQPAQGPAAPQDRFAQRLATRGQRAEYLEGAGAGLFQQVALAEERARGEQKVAQFRAQLVNMAQPEEAAQVRLETLLGARVEKMQKILALQARQSIMAGPNRGIFQQVAGLDAMQSMQQQLVQSRGQLRAMQSPRGMAVMVEQARVGRLVQRQQQLAGLQATFGKTGGTAAALGMEALPIVGAIVGAITIAAGLFRGAISGLKAPSEQLDNSFQLLTNEIGLTLIPAVKNVSGIFQGLAKPLALLNTTRAGQSASAGFWQTAFAGVGLGNVPAQPMLSQQAAFANSFDSVWERNVADLINTPQDLLAQQVQALNALNATLQAALPPQGPG